MTVLSVHLAEIDYFLILISIGNLVRYDLLLIGEHAKAGEAPIDELEQTLWNPAFGGKYGSATSRKPLFSVISKINDEIG